MSEGWEGPRGGQSTEVEDGAAPETGAEAPEVRKGGWVALPPHPDAPDGAQRQRFRAPWATATTASFTRTAPPAPADPAAGPDASGPSPEAPAAPRSRRFSLKRKGSAATGSAEVSEETTDAPVGAAPPTPPAARPERPGPAPSAGPQALEFTGTAGEYFRVWIVNVCLTVLTLGIYSAWAKVRTRRYFYRHTQLEGSPFDYLADPMQILKGRAILVLFLGAFGALGEFMPLLQTVLSVALTALVPWAVVRSLKFRAQVSAWRNIRFGFDGTYKEALAVFIGWPLVVAFTLGMAYPYYQWRRNRFITENSRFGTESFTFRATARQFYGMHLRIAGLMLLFVALAGAAAAVFFPVVQAQVAGSGMPAWASVTMSGAFVLGYFLIWTYARARSWNIVWNGTRIGPHRFESTIRVRSLFRLYVMNGLGVLLTFGLLVPWARVRMARYRLEHLHVVAAGPLTDFAQAQADKVGATGAEFGEAMDLDLAL